MNLKLSTAILDYEGKQITEGEKSITIKDLLITGLRYGGKDEKDEFTKYKRFSLLNDIIKNTSGEIELSSEQIVDTKKLVNEIYTDVWIFGQIVNILENK